MHAVAGYSIWCDTSDAAGVWHATSAAPADSSSCSLVTDLHHGAAGEDACVCAGIALLHLLKLPAGAKSAPTGSSTQGAAALVEHDAALSAAVCDKQGRCTAARLAGGSSESSSQPCNSSSADDQRSAAVTARDSELGHLLQSAGACDRYRARQLLAVLSMSHSQARVSRGMMKQVTEYFSSRPSTA